MSLFQAREWWSTAGDGAEEYDSSCMLVIDIFGRGEDVVLTASLSGCVRLWAPHFATSTDTNAVPGSPHEGVLTMQAARSTVAGVEDLLLEERLAAPILGLAVGRFSSVFPGLSIALLHPQSLIVYSVVSSNGLEPTAIASYAPHTSGKPALFYKLNKLYEHEFAATVGAHFSPANMTFGPFGQSMADNNSTQNSSSGASTVKDSIAVQSMDGQIAVFEQERFAFRRNLNAAGASGPANPLTYLLPGPITYIHRTDSILTVNAEMRLDSFRYSTLAGAWAADTATQHATNATSAATTTSTSAATSDAAAGRKLRADWSVNLGEHAHSISVGRLSPLLSSPALSSPPLSSPLLSSSGRSNTNTNTNTTATTFSATSGTGASGMGDGKPAGCDIVVAGERSFFVLRDSGPMFSSGSNADTASSPVSASLNSIHSAVRSQRKLDYVPACMAVYARGPLASASTVQSLFPEAYGSPFGTPTAASSGTNGTIVVSHSGVCHIYKGEALVWAARLPPNFVQAADTRSGRPSSAPVAVAVGRFSGMPGMLVFLSSRGDVSVCFCGTDPPVGSLTGGETVRDLDYAGMEKEHRSLLLKIREMQANAGSDRGGVAPSLTLSIAAPPSLDLQSASRTGGGVRGSGFQMAADGVEAKEDRGIDSCRVDYSATEWEDDGDGRIGHSVTWTASLKLTCASGSASDVRIVVRTPGWVVMPKDTRTFVLPQIITSGRPHTVQLPFACSRRGIPSADTTITVAASFVNEGGEVKTSVAVVEAPLSLAVMLIPPVKTAAYKLTVDINRSVPPSLLDVFADCFHQPSDLLPQSDALSRITSTAVAVLSFGFHCGGDATILASKAAGRFRVQAGSMEALALISSQLCQRLRRFFAAGGPGYNASDPPIALSYTEPLPLADFFTAVDSHYATRRKLLQAYSDLNDRAHEYRLVAKRLLVRWKEKSPQPLNGLDKLLAVSHDNVMAAGTKVSTTQDALIATANSLSCCIHVFLLLTELRFGISAASAGILSKAISPIVVDTLEQGWEEMTDASLTHLLKLLTSTSGEDTVASPAGVSQSLRIPEDTSRLRSHITLLLDRLSKSSPTALEDALKPV